MSKTLEEILAENGCTTVEEYNKKIADAALAPVNEELLKAKTALSSKEEQVTNLETIKSTQGTEIGSLRLKIKELTPAEPDGNDGTDGEKKEDNAGVKTPEQWKQENEVREASLSASQMEGLDELYKSLDGDTKKLISGSEEARSSFLDQVLGESSEPTQETFHRPKKKEKASIAEQIKAGLGQVKPGTTPRLQPSGIGFLNVNNNQKKPTMQEPQLTRNTGILDAVRAKKASS